MATVLMPVAQAGFDPTEAGVPFVRLRAAGHRVVVATPTGRKAAADQRMIDGQGLGPFKYLMRADHRGRAAYAAMADSAEFSQPLSYGQLTADCDALLLPGGHDKPMRVYLESAEPQAIVAAFFAAGKPVAAVCHGVVLAARSKRSDGKSVLFARKTTSLTRTQELTAFQLTRWWCQDYYLTYPETVESEVRRALASPDDYQSGPASLLRDAPTRLSRGFVVRDGNYLSARWPGDIHLFTSTFLSMLTELTDQVR